MKTMQNEVTNNQTIEKEIIKPSFPDVTETVFCYGKCTRFSNQQLGIKGEFLADSGKLEVKVSFKKGEYLAFVKLSGNSQIAFVKQPNKDCPLPLKDPGWHKAKINSNEDIPLVCKDLCHYDEENECLTFLMFVGNDYVLDYGTYPSSQSIYFQFTTGHRWRFLDRVMGG